ncbi:MAG: DUF58 domain-containing protein [Kiritimatiellia bacterium]|jgi:uncharacterized protein (DUF58 family)|nr:DUF58 domain-containing protein [Kiritimatiellia bacterium]MDP6810888.1 DUF58 domain-containing protein [Kiritimatiellia bacterium]MDP7023394.1 DUF58 domain-containing protein [Kiritimatiellia bacterium]
MPDATDNLTIDPRLLQRLKGVELRSRFLVRGLYENRHRTKDFGASNEFVEHKSYQQGDEIRTIDWRAFARTKRLYVKRFEMEANMKVHLLLDTSASMQVPASDGRLSKLDLAATIAGAIAMMAADQQDSPGLFCIGDQIDEAIPACQGKRHLALLFQHLGRPPGKGGGDFGALAWDAMQRIGRKGVTVVLTDALDDFEPLFETLKGLVVREQDVILLQIMDEDELTFPFDVMTEFRHPESGQRIMGDPMQLRADYLERLEAHQNELRTFCDQHGIDYLRIHNGDDLITLLSSHFLHRLARGGARC